MLFFFAILFLVLGLLLMYRKPIMFFIARHMPAKKVGRKRISGKVTSAEAKKTIEKNFKGLELMFGRINIAKIIPMLIVGGITLWFGSTLLSAINTSTQSSAYNTTALPAVAKTVSGLFPLIVMVALIPFIASFVGRRWD